MFEQRERESKKRMAPGAFEPLAAVLTLFFVFLCNALWNVIGPTLVAVLSALVQTGVTTRLVLWGLFSAAGFGLFAFKTFKQVWYGHATCVIALVVAWNMIARLAVEIQSGDVAALAGAACVLVHGLVNIQEGNMQTQVLKHHP
jgi:hypothetical protein